MAQPIMKSCFQQLINPEWENHLQSWKRGSLSKEKPKSSSPITLVKLEEAKNITSSFQKETVTSQSPIRFWVKDFCIEVGDNFSKTSLVQLIQTLRRI